MLLFEESLKPFLGFIDLVALNEGANDVVEDRCTDDIPTLIQKPEVFF
jgi:hypothetical protein